MGDDGGGIGGRAMSAACAEGAPVRVIHNPTSGGGAWDGEAHLRAALADRGVEWVRTGRLGEAREAAREWRDGLLLVVGGDGTVNEAVHGLGLAGFPEGVTLALLPTGTGNDLARTLTVPADPKDALETVRAGRTRVLDAARVRSGEVGERFFVNVAVGGAGEMVSEAADDESLKGRWGELAYSRAFVEVARSFHAPVVRLVVDGEERRVRALNVAVGNCRYAGGGWPAIPRANPEDGLLDLVVVEEAGLSGLLGLGRKALTGADYLGDEGVFFARGRSIRVETVPPGGFGFNADGELVGRGPVDFSVIPRALKVIVGSGYAPEPPERLSDRALRVVSQA
ncbi:YegS/Rv2252/BmrU family lipid kinase [Rubrobacter marinus]|uniref:YegS/Rv2252/BmrU family lipid kinase n=1 Tax=Rubrobacter marinus TaxID=2653852 RepID=A0A6G8PVZ3_9ACTN|nr:diacylglycerol kinase family protein [Rubrobacter marinus]QIN78366.1 YegS/Rv2252/BmrU family lipid kinase [Rubrobacter marinus]